MSPRRVLIGSVSLSVLLAVTQFPFGSDAISCYNCHSGPNGNEGCGDPFTLSSSDTAYVCTGAESCEKIVYTHLHLRHEYNTTRRCAATHVHGCVPTVPDVPGDVQILTCGCHERSYCNGATGGPLAGRTISQVLLMSAAAAAAVILRAAF